MKKDLLILKPKFKYKVSGRIEIAAIKSLNDLLRIDFISYRDLDSVNSWLNINEQTFIRPCGSNSKLTMIKALRIPIAPRRHYFFNRWSKKKFSLFFPSPPVNTTSIDIIESEGAADGCCNFYGVALTEKITSPFFIGGVKLEMN